MSHAGSPIEWTDSTWNVLRGCSRVSLGCGGPHGQGGCYAERVAMRFSGPGQPYHGLVKSTPAGPRWTGEVRFVEEALTLPLRWKSPRRIFVNSMSDLFHEKVADEWIDRIFAVMRLGRRHTYQVLTKRPERMRAYLSSVTDERLRAAGNSAADGGKSRLGMPNLVSIDMATARARFVAGDKTVHQRVPRLPLPNVHLGVSVEDQATADERIPLLLQTSAAVRWVSYEPALGPVDFSAWLGKRLQVRDYRARGVSLDDEMREQESTSERRTTQPLGGGELLHRVPSAVGDSDVHIIETTLDWVVLGGESGPGARPPHPDWFRSARDQCVTAGTPFFFKQAGSVLAREWGCSDANGAVLSELPADLQLREFPRNRHGDSAEHSIE